MGREGRDYNEPMRYQDCIPGVRVRIEGGVRDTTFPCRTGTIVQNDPLGAILVRLDAEGIYHPPGREPMAVRELPTRWFDLYPLQEEEG